MRAIAVDPTAPAKVFAATGSNGVFRSADGGETWAASNTGITTTSMRSLRIDASNAQKMYAGTASAGVFQSSDGGATWSLLGGSSPGLSVAAIATSSDGNVVHAGLNGGVWSYQFRPFDPKITISSPQAGGRIPNGAGFVIDIDEFTLDCATTGASGEARGHWRIDVDGVLDSTGCTERPTLTKNYSLGNHSVRISLRNPDDSALSPPAESTVSVTIVESMPKLRSVKK